MVTATLSKSREDKVAATCFRMQDGGDTQDSGLGHLEALVANKEREWKELHARRIHLLEDSLKKAKEECSSLRHQNQKLKEDFQYNLSILDEREKELERYDVITLRAVNAEQNRQEELGRLRLQVAALEEKRAKDAEARQEELRLSQKRAAQQKLQLDELRHSMTGTIQKQTEEHERVKLEAQHRLREMEGELTRQKQEVTATCAKQLGHREHEFNLKLDEMHAALLSKDLKIKLLSKECEAQSQARMQATRALKASEELCEQFRAKLQHEVDLKNEATAVKEVRIKELEDKLKRTENKLKKQKDDLIKKNEDVTRALKEKDEQLEARCQAHKEQLKRTEKHVIKLKNDLEIQAAKACLAQKDLAVSLAEKDDIIKRLRTEVTTAQTDWERCMSQTSNEMVGKNTELITLQNRISKLQAELERSREEINRYKQDVNAGLKREAALEQARVQLELEWQERYDAVKAKHYLANEQLIQDLTLARDQAKAELSEKEKELHDLTLLLPSVKKGSDKAAQGLTPKPDAQASEMNSLVEQNSFLRAVVSQMRKDMEDLGHLVPHQQNKLQAFPAKAVQASEATAAPPTTEPLAKHPDTSANTIPAYLSDDAQALKQEVVLLNARCRHLEEQLEGASGLPKSVPAAGTLKETPAQTCMGKPHPHDQRSQEVLCLDQRAESTAMRSQAARGPHAEQGGSGHAVVQQFQDENLYRWQQQLTSALMAGAASGNVQGVKRNIALAHARLKQAASYIARLSKEKQQLIQMGNCLRARITSTGLEEAIEQKKDSATNEQHDRLSALEQLQYRLTTQELQYAVRQMAHTVAEHAASSDSRGPPMEGDGNLCYTRHEPADESGTSKMSDKTPLISQQQNSLEVKTQPSSGESLQSLKEIWEILDHGLSSSVYSEGESELSRSRSAKSVTDGVMVTGTSAPIHSGSPAELQQKMNSSKVLSNLPKNCRHGAPDKIGKIRNYNTKD
ncbi:coiled-coil domain-containing protein 57 isoform X2 [Hippocampus comes]|uniref:coiled-coil domain-containing protein 57 isoform X2 n=1 Tax=Hippocampus comes TaxID=109280 RepID=UPI00094F2E4E|nr:PREDICTED: coiled-coil domain-containing protein 57 isoform X2 [Hippocampus comes]